MHTDWMSTGEAAELSGYSPERIRRLIREGKISAHQKGGRFWIDRASLTMFLRVASKARSEATIHSGPSPINAVATPSKADVKNQTVELDPEVEEYMRMAARMLYDIIRDWRADHSKELAERTQKNS